jgi:exodeoxyribonuclease-3
LGDIFFGSVYVPNAKMDLARLPFRQLRDKVLLEYMKQLDKKKPIVMIGDMNVAHQPIDLKHPKKNE